MGVSLVALRCRTADRFPGAPRGVEILAPLVAGALGVEPRFIGIRGRGARDALRGGPGESRGCLLEAGGQIEDALTGGNTPVLLAADCSVAATHAARRWAGTGRTRGSCGSTATATTTRPRPRAAATSAACAWPAATGEWDAGLGGDAVPAEHVVLAGVRDLDPGERELLERSAATVIGASPVETLVAAKNALEGAPVFMHLDLDVIDPEHFPAAVPAPGGLHPDKLYDLMESVLEDSRAGGDRDHELRRARRRGGARRGHRDGMHVLEPRAGAAFPTSA